MGGRKTANSVLAILMVATGLGAGALFGLTHEQPPKATELLRSRKPPFQPLPPPPPAKPAPSAPASSEQPPDVKRYVGVRHASLYEHPDVTSKVLRPLQFGEKLLVQGAPRLGPGGPFLMLSAAEGYVRADALLTVRPTYEEVLLASRAALQTVDLERALRAAEEAHALEPSRREAVDLLYFLHRALGHEEQAQALQALRETLQPAPEKPPDAPSDYPPRPGETVYVMASRLPLHAMPEESSSIDAVLERGDALRVYELTGSAKEWAYVLLSNRPGVRLQKWPRGFVRVPALAHTPTAREDLFAAARALRHNAQGALALERLIRVANYEPDPLALQEVLDTAVAEKRVEEAVWAATELMKLRGPKLEVEVVFGCRGARDRAKVLSASELPEDLSGLPANACVRGPPPPANLCAPCAPDVYAFARPRQLDMPGYDAALKKFKEADARRATAAESYDAQRRRLREAFPDGPFFHVRVTGNQLLPWQRGKKLYLYRATLGPAEPCGQGTFARRDLQLKELPLKLNAPPMAPPQEEWIPGSGASSELGGLLIAAGEGPARTSFDDEPLQTAEASPRSLGPVPNAWLDGDLPCACCP